MRVAKNVYAVLDLFHSILGVNAGFVVTNKHIVYDGAGWTIPSPQTFQVILLQQLRKTNRNT